MNVALYVDALIILYIKEVFKIKVKLAGLNSCRISVKEWATKINAVSIISKAERCANKDIAFEFCR